MEQITKKRIQEQIYSETQSSPFTIDDIYQLHRYGTVDTLLSDELSFDYSEDNDGQFTYTLWVYRWRDETDEELQIRIDRAKQTMPDTIIAVLAKEYKELKEIKVKYQQLIDMHYGTTTE